MYGVFYDVINRFRRRYIIIKVISGVRFGRFIICFLKNILILDKVMLSKGFLYGIFVIYG